MATLNQRLQDPCYKAWIKTGLCLSFAKAGLEDFADQSSKTFHHDVINVLRNNGNPSCNGVCCYATINRGRVSCCNNCQAFLDEIDQQNQKSFQFKQHNWDNSDMKLWLTDPWEMSKVFMNAGQKATQRSPVDTDLSGILNFIDHCVVAKRCIVNTHNISKVRDVRNKVMHSASMTLSQTELSDFTGAIVDLLEDPGALGQSKSAHEALTNIRKIIASDFNITKENEIKVIMERTKVLQLKLRLLEKDVQSNVETLKELKSTEDRNVTELQEKIGLLHDTEQEVNNEIQILKGHIDTFDDIRDGMRLHLKTLDDTREEIKRLFEVTSQEINVMNKKLEALETKNIILMQRQAAIEQKESNIEDQVCELRKTLSAEASFSKAANQLQEALIEQYKQVGFEVPLSPIYDGLNDDLLKVNIDEVYTDLDIVIPERNEEIELISCKDIFRRKGRTNRTIFLKGEAGVGKSTWCVQLLYAWVKKHDKDFHKSQDPKTHSGDDSNERMRDLEEAVSQFEYMFFVPLRYVRGKSCIKDILFSPPLERLSNHELTARKLIEKCSDKILILLDGIDEYAHDLSYEGLNLCTVITTTRPWKFDLVHSSNPGLKIDMILNLKGLDRSGIEQLANRVYKTIVTSRYSRKQGVMPSEEQIEYQVMEFMSHARRTGLTDVMNIPLTLVIMLESYLEKDGFFSHSMAINLVSLLEVLVERGERKAMQSDLGKSAVKNCKASAPESGENIVACFADKESISDYEVILQKLSKLAFDGLTSTQKEDALTFSEKQINEMFTEDELLLCLKFGLISRSRYFASMLSKMKQFFSFYHKLVQEFFAAVWIVSSPVALDDFKKCISSVSAILELDNVFVFICGIDAHIGSVLSKHYVDVYINDSVTQDAINNQGVENSRETINISTLMLRGQTEVDLSAKPDEPLFITDMITTFDKVPVINENTFLKLLKPSTRYLRVLYLSGLKICIPDQMVSQLLNIIGHAVGLQELHLDDDFVSLSDRKQYGTDIKFLPTRPEVYLSFHKRLSEVTLTGNYKQQFFELCLPILLALRFLPNLKHLTLAGRGIGPRHVLLDVISSLQNLKSLSVKHVSISSGDLIVNSEYLKALHLRRVNISKSSFIISNACQLELVIIDDLKMSTAGWSALFEQLSKQSSLIELELREIGKRNECLHLSKSGKLRKLTLTSLELPALTVFDGTDLEELILEKVKMPVLGWLQLFSAFEFTNLKIIRLTHLNTGSFEVDLSQASQLERVSIANVKMCQEDPIKQEVAETVTIVPTNNTGWETFFGLLPTKHLRQLSLYNLDLGTAAIRIDEESCLFRICIEGVNMSKKSFDILLSSLRTLPKLQIADIDAVRVEEELINMTIEDIRK